MLVRPEGKPVATLASATPEPSSARLASATRDGYTQSAATEGISGCVGAGQTAFAASCATLPGVSWPSSVVRSTIDTTMRMACCWDSDLIERLPSTAARSSTPTRSTGATRRLMAISVSPPGRPAGRNPLEVGDVPGGHAEAVRNSGRADPEIVRADEMPALGELGPELRMHTGDRLGDRDRAHAGEQVLDERAPARSAVAGRPMHPVKQFAHGYDADRALLVAEERSVSADRAAFAVDEQVGVDQEATGRRRFDLGARSTDSAAKPSSSGGAVAIRSRKRSAETSWVVGGTMTATGAPLRVISTSSPAATRLRTSKKLRAASVAVSRATSRDR